MEENTIFKPSAHASSQPVSPTVPLTSASKPLPTLGESPPPHTYPTKTILKAVLGAIIVLTIGFLVFKGLGGMFGKKDQKVTLTYWGLWEDPNIIKSILDDFHKENPNITVVYTKQDSKEYLERLNVRSQNGTGPDIFRFHNTWVPQLLEVLLPLSKDVITPSDFIKSYFPIIQNDLIRNGAIYGIPLEIDTLSLFVNTELFKNAGYQAPTNWDDFLKVARGLTVKDETGAIKTSGAAIGTFDNVTHAPDIISLLMLQNGTDLKNISKNPKAASDALLFYTSLAKPTENVWDSSFEQSLLAFAGGKVGMYFGFSWDVFPIKALNPNLVFEIKEVPHLFGRNITVASYWAEGVSQKSKYQKQAFIFMKYLARKETLEKLYASQAKTRIFGEPYPRVDLAETLKQNSFAYPFVKQAKEAQSSFFASDTFDNGLNAKMNVYLGNAVRSIFDNTSPESATDTLASGVNQVLSQYEPKPQK